MLCVGTDVSIVCAEGVTDAKERQRLLASLNAHQTVSALLLLSLFVWCMQWQFNWSWMITVLGTMLLCGRTRASCEFVHGLVLCPVQMLACMIVLCET